MQGIEYSKPEVYLLQDSGIGVAELAGRTAYDSFDKSENEAVRDFGGEWLEEVDKDSFEFDEGIISLNTIEYSGLLDQLAWVHFHHSVVEHSILSYLIKGMSRGVLQEMSRHRIGVSPTVRSTRYTMAKVLYAFIAAFTSIDSVSPETSRGNFFRLIKKLDMFVITDDRYLKIETDAMYDKLFFQVYQVGVEEFYKSVLAKDNLEFILGMINGKRLTYLEIFEVLSSNKSKRNVGDHYKHLVTDNWKVDMVVTFNLRSLKHFFDLRESGSAWFQIQWLAEAIKEATPKKYLRLIDKKFKED